MRGVARAVRRRGRTARQAGLPVAVAALLGAGAWAAVGAAAGTAAASPSSAAADAGATGPPAALATAAADAQGPGAATAAPGQGPAAAGEEGFDSRRALAELRRSIAGREDEPAGTVFENVQVLAEVPAGRLLAIMDRGFSRALGVTCTHCHDPEHWEADEIGAKNVARAMAKMVRDLNQRILPSIQGLETKNPTVNCTTCHRGSLQPALELPEPAEPPGEGR